MIELERLLQVLHDGGVEFVVIGGVAMVLRGSSRVTVDLGVCYARDTDNLRRLASALAPYHPRLRGAPPELPFVWDERTLASGLNVTLTTDLGDIGVLGEVPGLGPFPTVAGNGIRARCRRHGAARPRPRWSGTQQASGGACERPARPRRAGGNPAARRYVSAAAPRDLQAPGVRVCRRSTAST